MITDTLPAISLGLDPDAPDVMKEKPRLIKEGVFANGSGTFTCINGLLIGLITLIAFIVGIGIYSGPEAIFTTEFADVPREALVRGQTMAFITLSVSQLFHSINLRSTKKSLFQVGIFSNKYLLASILIGTSIQVALVNTPVFKEIFKIASITLKDWLFVLTLSALPVVFNELFKMGKRMVKAQQNSQVV